MRKPSTRAPRRKGNWSATNDVRSVMHGSGKQTKRRSCKHTCSQTRRPQEAHTHNRAGKAANTNAQPKLTSEPQPDAPATRTHTKARDTNKHQRATLLRTQATPRQDRKHTKRHESAVIHTCACHTLRSQHRTHTHTRGGGGREPVGEGQ